MRRHRWAGRQAGGRAGRHMQWAAWIAPRLWPPHGQPGQRPDPATPHTPHLLQVGALLHVASPDACTTVGVPACTLPCASACEQAGSGLEPGMPPQAAARLCAAEAVADAGSLPLLHPLPALTHVARALNALVHQMVLSSQPLEPARRHRTGAAAQRGAWDSATATRAVLQPPSGAAALHQQQR